MSVKSYKNLSLDELEDILQEKRNRSINHSKNNALNQSKDSLFKDSLPFINMPNISNIKAPKNPPAQSSSLQNALKDLQRTNSDLENKVKRLRDKIG